MAFEFPGGTYDPEFLKVLQQNLSKYFNANKLWIWNYWQILDKDERRKVIEAGSVYVRETYDSPPPSHALLTPEWNVEHLTHEDNLLLSFCHAAATPLHIQYRHGWIPLETLGCEENKMDTGSGTIGGDYHVIKSRIDSGLLCHDEPFRNWYTFFTEDRYGESIELKDKEEKFNFLRDNKHLFADKFCIPRATGELILARQTRLLNWLGNLVYDILDAGKATEYTLVRSKLRYGLVPPRHSIQAYYFWQTENSSANLGDPYMLQQSLPYWISSCPELVNHEGGTPQTDEDKCVSIGFLDAVNFTSQRVCIWGYITFLYSRVEAWQGDEGYDFLLRELASICHFEYRRAQKMMRRQLSTAKFSAHCFERCADSGSTHVQLKGKPETLAAGDEQLYYLLTLCHPSLAASEAPLWLEKLDKFYDRSALKRDELAKSVMHALGELLDIAHWIQVFSECINMPVVAPPGRKNKGLASRLSKLEMEVSQLRGAVDLPRFVDSSTLDGDNNALTREAMYATDETFTQFCLDKLGSGIPWLYDDALTEASSKIVAREKALVKGGDNAGNTSTLYPFPVDREARLQRGREEGRLDQTIRDFCRRDMPPSQPGPRIQVTASTFYILSLLFADDEESRGPVLCDSFDYAFKELGFNKEYLYGTIFIFSPPITISPIVDGLGSFFLLRRDNWMRLDRAHCQLYGRILRRRYGWSKETFELAPGEVAWEM